MIVPARRRLPRQINYRRVGMGGYMRGLGDNTVGQTSGNYTWDGRQWVLSSTGLPEDVTSGNLDQAVQESQAAGIPVNVPQNLQQALPKASYNDLIASAGGFKTCDPRDTSCVLYNTQLQSAVEDYWVSHNMDVPAGTVVKFTPNLSSAAVSAFGTPGYVGPNPQNVVTPGTIAISGGGGPVNPPPVQTPAGGGGAAANVRNVSAQPYPLPGTVNLQGAPSPNLGPAAGNADQPVGGTSLLGNVPWYVWAGGAALALFVLGGKH